MDIYETQAIPLNKLKQTGYTFFKRKPDAKIVYVVNHYDRGSKSYSCSDAEDMNREVFIKANKPVFIGFEY